MISNDAKLHANKCRFCWMCRHLCPVQLVSGKEVNTPRAKGLLLSMIERGAEFDKDTAAVMYECLLCDACTNDCATGYNPPLFIREARTEAMVLDLVPESVQKVLDKIEETGNIYGEEKPSCAKETGKEVLLYVGATAAIKAPEMVKAYMALLDRAGVGYTVLADEPESGLMLGDLMGYVDEVQEEARVLSEKINAVGAAAVVVMDSYDGQIMAEKYPEWGVEIQAPVKTAAAYVAELLKAGKLTVNETAKGIAAYHDDDRMARYYKDYESGRAIAKACGYETVEMFNHFDLAKSAGTSVAKAYMPEIVSGVAAGRWDDLKRTEAKVMLTVSPEAYECLADTVPEGYELVDLFSALLAVAK